MREKSIELVLPTIVLALTLILGPASQALAGSLAQAERLDVLVSFTEKPGPAEQAVIHDAGGKVKRNYHIVPTIAASVPKAKLDSLHRNPKVTSVEEDIIVQIIADELPWGVDRIDAEVVHSQNKGWGVRVAILDTGIDLDHPDLRVTGDVSFVDGAVNGDDDHGHGTMVAGIVAALDNDIGVVGVAPEAELYAVKVLNQNGSSVSGSILAGIEWAVDNNMQVVNMSFGGILNLPWAVRTALDKAYQAGIVLIAGAGNAGDGGIIYSPARYEAVIAVGAVDQQDVRASFSSTGPDLELVAPGVAIMSTSRDGGYDSGSGTSLSTPHVVGIAALLIASGSTNSIEVRQILQNTAEDLGSLGWDSWYGCGLANAAEALAIASPSTSASGAASGNVESADKVPPRTTIELSGMQGNSGWYRSSVTVELVAVDNPSSSGVAETRYSLDDGKTWQSYYEPFTITLEGINIIQARSRDNAGNVEGLPAYRKFRIDRTGPSVSISVAPSLIWPTNHKQAMMDVLVTGSAVDELSGLGSFQLVVADEYGQVEPRIGSYLQRRIWLEAWRDGHDLDGRVYTISITATDCAGNTATATTTVTVPHDRRKKSNE